MADYARAVTTRFAYDGAHLMGEYNGSGALLRRYVFGPGQDEPLVWYEGSGTSDRRWLAADERGSIVAVVNASNVVTNINTYDAFGLPGSSNQGRFQYTGQAWIPEAQLYHYKARAYLPALGRFLQTDPLGFAAGDMNLYTYVFNDPINLTDPSGASCISDSAVVCMDQIGICPGCGGSPWWADPTLIWVRHAIRAEREWSQEDLADEAKLRRTYVSGLERGIKIRR